MEKVSSRELCSGQTSHASEERRAAQPVDTVSLAQLYKYSFVY